MNAVVTAADKAQQILAGLSVPVAETLQVAAALNNARVFGLLRKLLEKLSTDPAVQNDAPMRDQVAKQLALATYKDADLPADLKFDRAIHVLRSAVDIDTTTDQEILGMLGAIYKRKWDSTGRESDLATSANFYLRGFAQPVQKDNGYTGINAAFLLDLLGEAESNGVRTPATQDTGVAHSRSQQSQAIRRKLIAELNVLLAATPALADDWWFAVTLGEAYFGVGDFQNAGTTLARAAALENVPDWRRETTARQLSTLKWLMEKQAARDGKPLDPAALEVLRNFLGDAAPALEAIEQGKIGVALSGGGFRASLYHIGVLARLAELDLLRGVEYLSCVSGGSIIGAHYYLEVQNLLATKTDAQITAEDYVRIVARVADDFLAGVQRNIRTRVAAEWLTNLKMVFVRDYSRTLRAGELYEREIFARVQDGKGGKNRWMDDLMVIPKGEVPDFRPKDHNWRRRAKVPILILNATSLNTGHNWQFTATWMGEPPGGIDTEVDANYRLRRMYYSDAPKPYGHVRLGYAVAASACVPGLFEPLSLPGLYPAAAPPGPSKPPIVRLVDGGVYDNQGTSALLEQGCTVLVVSDASGQMDTQDAPSNGLLGVPLRANSVLQSRVRVSQFEALEGLRRGGLLKGLMFVHLKKDLESVPVDWVDCQDPSRNPPPTPLSSYGIQKSVQRRLAAIRTDLDSFSEVEGYALMTSGYLMTRTALGKPVLGFAATAVAGNSWKFLGIESYLAQPSSSALNRQLKVADKLAFKVWLLMRKLQIFGGVALVGLLVLAALGIRDAWNQEFKVTLGSVLLWLGFAVLSLAGFGVISKIINYRKTVQDVLIGIGMALLGFALARLHLHVFDRIFLLQGRLKGLK